LSKNLAIFFVSSPDCGEIIRTWPEKNLVLVVTSPMWIRYYSDSNECKILRTTKTLELVGITDDEQFENLKKDTSKIVIIEEPFFELKHYANIELEQNKFYRLDEAIEFADTLPLAKTPTQNESSNNV
jgi:hypothetical protein